MATRTMNTEILPNCGISSSAEDDSSAVFASYFIASKDGKNFSHISAGDVESALAQNMFVYVVDDPSAVQPVEFYLSGETAYLNDETSNLGASNAVIYLDNTAASAVNPSTGLNLLQQVSISSPHELTIPQPSSASHLDSIDNVLSIIAPPICATMTDSNYHLTASSLETSLTSAKKQTRTARKGNSRVCTVCYKVFSTSREFSSHIVTHENDRPHACSYCSQTFNQIMNLKIHLAMHHYSVFFGESIGSHSVFTCPVCECKPFSRRAAFHAHLLTHQSEETLTCDLCQKVFLSPPLLNAHISTKHPSVSAVNDDQVQLTTKVPIKNGYRCQKCGQFLPSAGLIRRHYRLTHPTAIQNNQSTDKNDGTEPVANMSGAANGCVIDGPRLSKIRAVAFVNAIVKKQQRHPPTTMQQYDEFIHKFPEEDVTTSVGEQVPCSQSRRKRKKKRVFPCSLCSRQFINRCMLSRHMTKHTKSKPFECRICHARFSQKSSVKTHLALHTNQSRQACPLCKRRFKLSTNLVIHLQSVHRVKAEIVDNVGVDIDSTPCATGNTIIWQYQPLVPQTDIVRDEPISTEKPTEIFNNYAHQSTVDQQRPYSCSVCRKRFTLRRSLSIHMLRHSPTNLPYTCHICPRRFATLAHKNYHVASHSTHAARTAARVQRLARLKAWQHSEVRRSGPLVWNSSQNTYVNVDDRKRLCVRPHACFYCPKSYLHAHHLALHVRQQHCLDRAPYACDRCTRRFTSEAGLNRHMASRHFSCHSKVQRFTCNVCLVSFSAVSSLRRHMLVHTGEKSYKCHICQRKFRHLSSCRRHVNRHADDSTATGLFSASLDAEKNVTASVVNNMMVSNSQHMKLTSTNVVESMPNINTGNFNFTANKISNYSDFDGVTAYDDQNSKRTQLTVPNLYPVVYISGEQQALSTIPVNGVYYVPTNESVAAASVAFEGLHTDAPSLEHGTLLSAVEMPATDATCDRNDSMPKTNWSLYLTYHDTDGSCELPHSGMRTLPMVEPGVVQTFDPNPVSKDEGDQLTGDPLPFHGASDIPDFITNASYIIDLDATGLNVNTPYETHSAYMEDAAYQPLLDEPISEVEQAPAEPPISKERQSTDADTAIIVTLEVPTDVAAVEYFGCGRCSAKFSTGLDLLKHSHLYHLSVPTPHSCPNCLKAFASEVLLQAHEQLYHGPEKEGDPVEGQPLLQCPACRTTTTTSSALTRHILACHPMSSPDPFRCTSCGMTFRHMRSLKAHVTLKACHNSIDKVGSVAKKGKTARTELKGKVSETVPHSSSESKQNLGVKQKMPAPESDSATGSTIRLSSGATICPVCGRGFKLSSDLKRHLCVHSGVRPHQCQVCPRSFLKHCQLQRHLASVHAGLAVQSTGSGSTGKPDFEAQASERAPSVATCSPGVPVSVADPSLCDIRKRQQTGQRFSEPTPSLGDVIAGEATAQQTISDDLTVPLKLPPLQPLMDPSDLDKPLLDLDLLVLPRVPSLTPFLSPTTNAATGSVTPSSFTTVIVCKHCDGKFPNNSEYKSHTCRPRIASASASAAGGTSVDAGVSGKQRLVPKKSRRFDLLYRCAHCGKNFSQAWLLRRHEAGHVRQQQLLQVPEDDRYRPFRCPCCPQAFAMCANMKRHMERLHRSAD